MESNLKSELPEYFSKLTLRESIDVALGRLRPRVGERWPATYEEWLTMAYGAGGRPLHGAR